MPPTPRRLGAGPCIGAEYEHDGPRPGRAARPALHRARCAAARARPAAEAVVWLGHPFPLVASRLLRRSVGRAVTRRPLYNGNVERASTWLRASHPLRIVLSREFGAKRHRTAQELAAAERRGVL